MIEQSYGSNSLLKALRFIKSPVPWQHIYRQTMGKRHANHGPAHWTIGKGSSTPAGLQSFRPQATESMIADGHPTWADPFLFEKEGRVFLFFENWPSISSCGKIAVAELDAEGKLCGDPVNILTDTTHFSYPFVFEYDDQIWMLPENSASGSLQLYKCADFPHVWKPDKILMKGTRYADPTLFEHDGRWWLFLTLGTGLYGVNTNLFLFSADSPLSDSWLAHPQNPIVSGFHCSRPAGRIRKEEGRILRPSQDCFKRYGNGLRINEITDLSMKKYSERPVRALYPWNESVIGIHHVEILDQILLIDTHSLIN